MANFIHGNWKKYGNFYCRWSAMMSRCYNKKNKSYNNYGKKGIVVSKDWHDFNNFLKDMYPNFIDGMNIDRINNNKGYSKENCRWATVKENQNNRRNNKYYTFNNLTMSILEWSKYLGIKRSTLAQRIYVYGWSIEKSFNKGVNFG